MQSFIVVVCCLSFVGCCLLFVCCFSLSYLNLLRCIAARDSGLSHTMVTTLECRHRGCNGVPSSQNLLPDLGCHKFRAHKTPDSSTIGPTFLGARVPKQRPASRGQRFNSANISGIKHYFLNECSHNFRRPGPKKRPAFVSTEPNQRAPTVEVVGCQSPKPIGHKFHQLILPYFPHLLSNRLQIWH